MGSPTHRPAHPAEDGEDRTDDDEDDPERGEDADVRQNSDEYEDDSDDDHGHVCALGPLSSELRFDVDLVTSYPHIDEALVGDVLHVLGVDRSVGVETLTAAFRGWLPAGSTAKWLAVDEGASPPGFDPRTALEARLDGSLESWSCWPFCTGLGAILSALGHDVRIAVEHLRTGHNVPLVDYHSVLVVGGSLLDPFLGPSAPVAPGEDVVRPDAWASWVPGPRPDHLGARGGSTPFRYRQLADHLDRRDVQAFCAVSATHTGVGRRRTAHWLRDGRLWFVGEADAGGGTAELRVTEGTSPFESRRRVVGTGRFEELRAQIDEPTSLTTREHTE